MFGHSTKSMEPYLRRSSYTYLYPGIKSSLIVFSHFVNFENVFIVHQVSLKLCLYKIKTPGKNNLTFSGLQIVMIIFDLVMLIFESLPPPYSSP